MASADKQVQTSRSMFFQAARKMFKSFDVELNGDRPGDIKVNNDNLYFRLFKFIIGYDRLAFGEAYMDGDWDGDLLPFFEKALKSKYTFHNGTLLLSKIRHSLPLLTFNLQTKSRCKKDISTHYDIGNDMFKLMLDRSMNYSCGYWTSNVDLQTGTYTLCETVDEAQMNKMKLIARKLDLKPNMRVLDIGCGWGYLAKFLAINFDVHVVGITISKEQFEYATTTDLEKEDLEFLRIPGTKSDGSGTFEFKLQDYRDVKENFDRIVSVGMLEHVGKKNYEEYFKIVHRCMKDDGLALIQTISVCQGYVPQVEPWTNKYIFPGGMAPYPDQLIDATFGKFVIEDWHNMGFNYYRTLMAWHANFTQRWPQIEAKYGNRFKRMWEYFLLTSAAVFKSRKLHLWQVVLSKDGYAGGYVSYR